MTEQDKEIQELRRLNEYLTNRNLTLSNAFYNSDEYVYTDENKETIRKAIEEHGPNVQIVVAMEEMAELTKELSKAYRMYYDIHDETAEARAFRANLIEEIADVKIMVKQMQEVFKVRNEELNSEIEAKLNRLKTNLAVDEKMAEDYSWVHY